MKENNALKFMDKYILALNCGSSSAKFNLFGIGEGNRLNPVIYGIAEEIGNCEKSSMRYTVKGEKYSTKMPVASHQEALAIIFAEFRKFDIDRDKICSVGHRVVHGGEKYKRSVRIDENVIETIRELIPIAPLHNPLNLKGIVETGKLLPDVPQVAVFDTAFHATIPLYAFKYAVPCEWYESYGVRRYGFHGTSHLYVSKRAARMLRIPYNRFNCITAHLGNGCSITKVCCGKSMDTSMGFTPLEGLVMGTRSGDIDPAIIPHVVKCLMDEKCISEAEAYRYTLQVLNNESGLKALGNTNLMQEIRQKAQDGDVNAREVIDIYSYRVAKYTGSYWATLPGAHAIVFTAGVGENEGYVRKRILSFLENLEFKVDDDANSVKGREVIIAESKAKGGQPLVVMVIPTDEEIVIAYDALHIGFLGEPAPEVYAFEID